MNADPGEVHPLDGVDATLRSDFERFARHTEAAAEAVTGVDEELARKLKALGYLE